MADLFDRYPPQRLLGLALDEALEEHEHPGTVLAYDFPSAERVRRYESPAPPERGEDD